MSTLDANCFHAGGNAGRCKNKGFGIYTATVYFQKPANPFVQISQEQVLSDLTESRQQIAAGQGLNMEDALNRMGRQHGFI